MIAASVTAVDYAFWLGYVVDSGGGVAVALIVLAILRVRNR